MKIGDSRIDTQAVVEGVWTTFIIKKLDGTIEEIELRLALSSPEINKEYRKATRRAMEPHSRILSLINSGKSSRIPDDVAAKINADARRCFLENVVTDWKGITDQSGKAVPYSADGMEKLLEEFPELLSEIEDEASKVERYRVSVLEAQAGN